MIAVNSLGSQNGRHRSIWNSRSGEQKDLIECRFLSSHHELLIKKQTPPPLLFPVSSFVLSERCTEKPASSMAESGTIADIQVSVRQITQHSLVSRWYEMRARSSQSLLSSDWTLASKMVGRGGRKARRLSLTRTPALFPLFRLRFFRRGRAFQTKGSDAVSKGSDVIALICEIRTPFLNGLSDVTDTIGLLCFSPDPARSWAELYSARPCLSNMHVIVCVEPRWV